jgi:3-hydroxybutyryl-CoA dehydrogenase
MSHPTVDFATVALLGSDGRDTDLRDALAASGREVLSLAADAPELSRVDLVIDAGGGDLEASRGVLARVAASVAADLPIVTATTLLSVTDLATAVPNPARVAGLHVFTAGPGRRTVEVVPALQTADALVDRLVALVDSIEDKVAVVVKDRPGFLLDALFRPYLNDVIQELDDGLATAEDIDVALQLGLGYRVGPFALLDRMGLDAHLRTTRAIFDATGDRRFAPPPLLHQMVAAELLGEHSGGGFRAPTRTPDN